MQQGKIGVTTENIFPVIKKFLYSDHDIFLRELISNAVDATQKIKILASAGQVKGELGDLTIRVKLDPDKKTLTISDRGIGMTADEIDRYINQIAFSGAEEFIEKYKDQSIIGHFGLGFYSAFMVSDKVEILTQSYQPDTPTIKWSCTGSPEYTLEESAERRERGTDIILYLNTESAEFAERGRISEILKKYCSFLPVPISLMDGEKDNIINDTEPLWTRKPADINHEQYVDFYRKLYPMAEDPLFYIHLNIDYPFNLTGILYFPKLRNNFEIQKNKIQLYSNQVFITDSVEGIVPEFLTLLHGVIDSPDIPLNVSRSYLQNDANVRKISGYITRKVADRLGEIFNSQRDEYTSKWDDLKVFIQYGIITDEKFAEKAGDFLLLKNVQGKYFTLKEYAELVRGNQTDRHGNVVYLYSNDRTEQFTFIRSAENKGYDVLLMDGQLENHFIGWFESKNPGTRFVRVDADVAEKLIDKESNLSMLLSTEQQDTLRPVFESQLPADEKTLYTVSFEPMAETQPPVVITRDEFMRRMKDMASMGGGGMSQFYGQMPQQYNIVVNGNHPVVAEIFQQAEKEYGEELASINKKIKAAGTKLREVEGSVKDTNKENLTPEQKESLEKADQKLSALEQEKKTRLTEIGKENKLVRQIIDLALLSGGMLKGENLSNFISRSVELLGK